MFFYSAWPKKNFSTLYINHKIANCIQWVSEIEIGGDKREQKVVVFFLKLNFSLSLKLFENALCILSLYGFLNALEL